MGCQEDSELLRRVLADRLHLARGHRRDPLALLPAPEHAVERELLPLGDVLAGRRAGPAHPPLRLPDAHPDYPVLGRQRRRCHQGTRSVAQVGWQLERDHLLPLPPLPLPTRCLVVGKRLQCPPGVDRLHSDHRGERREHPDDAHLHHADRVHDPHGRLLAVEELGAERPGLTLRDLAPAHSGDGGQLHEGDTGDRRSLGHPPLLPRHRDGDQLCPGDLRCDRLLRQGIGRQLRHEVPQEEGPSQVLARVEGTLLLPQRPHHR
mmetsp:Transcript_89899/g.201241  ORF Transcript_89899/g.201241 Transcript_89899/m.201241 type:complete len:263 (-) Transcript_89899:260-1048(-)